MMTLPCTLESKVFNNDALVFSNLDSIYFMALILVPSIDIVLAEGAARQNGVTLEISLEEISCTLHVEVVNCWLLLVAHCRIQVRCLTSWVRKD